MSRWSAVAALACLAACAPPEPETTAVLDVPGDGSAPAYGHAPFPSDAWRPHGLLEPPDGIEALFPRRTDAVVAHLSTLDGFGVRPAIEFPIDGELDAGSVAGHAHVLDAAGNEVPYEWRWDPERHVVAGAPALGVVLAGGATYTAVLERGVLDADGRALAAAPGLERLAAGEVPARWQSTAAALAGLDRRELAAVTVFTVERAQRVLRAGRALLDGPDFPAPRLSFPDPALVFAGAVDLDRLLGQATRFTDGPRAGSERWGTSNPTGIAHDHVGVIASGVMTTARFRAADDGTDGPGDETFTVDPETGAPAIASMDAIPVTFVLPAAPPPPDGYPVAIFGHGLGSSRHAVLSFAEPLTAAGFAIVAIDADGHGSRWRAADVANNLAGMLPDFTGEADMADGFGDRTGLLSTFDFLEDLDNFSAARDAIGQSVLDVCQLVAMLRQPDLDLAALAGGGEPPRLDGRRIAYLGESFGTILGGILAAIEPDVDLFVLDVPAAGIVDLSIINSPALATVLMPLARTKYGVHGALDRFHPAISLLQALVDPADPLTYAPDVLRHRRPVGHRTPGPRHVVAIEVVGDEVLHNVASESLARAMGLELLQPSLAVPEGLEPIASPASANLEGQTAVLVQYAPATHGANWTSEVGTLSFVPGFPHDGDEPFPRLAEPIDITNPIYATLDQVVTILETHLGGDAPEVQSTLAPDPDLDGDGVPDL